MTESKTRSQQKNPSNLNTLKYLRVIGSGITNPNYSTTTRNRSCLPFWMALKSNFYAPESHMQSTKNPAKSEKSKCCLLKDCPHRTSTNHYKENIFTLGFIHK